MLYCCIPWICSYVQLGNEGWGDHYRVFWLWLYIPRNCICLGTVTWDKHSDCHLKWLFARLSNQRETLYRPSSPQLPKRISPPKPTCPWTTTQTKWIGQLELIWFWEVDIGKWVFGNAKWILEIVQWVLGIEYWELGIKYYILGIENWVLGIGN